VHDLDLLRQVQAFQHFLESWVVAQWIQERFNLYSWQQIIALLEGSLQFREGFIPLTKRGLDQGHMVRHHILRFSNGSESIYYFLRLVPATSFCIC